MFRGDIIVDVLFRFCISWVSSRTRYRPIFVQSDDVTKEMTPAPVPSAAVCYLPLGSSASLPCIGCRYRVNLNALGILGVQLSYDAAGLRCTLNSGSNLHAQTMCQPLSSGSSSIVLAIHGVNRSDSQAQFRRPHNEHSSSSTHGGPFSVVGTP
jgi:hypothetical protein